MNKNQQAFLALLRAGLWEEDVQLKQFGTIDYTAIYEIAQEQSVVGLVAAGLEHVPDVKVPKEDVLVFAGSALQLEQRNLAMNAFIASLISEFTKANTHVLLVKGQGVAQCYERPLWRASGDIDLLVDPSQYDVARVFLLKIAESADVEIPEMAHQAVFIGPWEVELHGSLHGLWSPLVDKTLDVLQEECFGRKEYRTWDNNGTIVNLPSIEYDIIFIFTHILQHFFRGGVGLRQICDFARMLWCYQNNIDIPTLRNRLHMMKLLSEWRTFGSLCVVYLGLPVESMPLFSQSGRWNRKARRLLILLLDRRLEGFAFDSDDGSTNKRKLISLKQHTSDLIQQFNIFPLDSVKVWLRMIKIGVLGLLTRKK